MRIVHQFVSCKDVIKDKRIVSYMSKMINETNKDHKERFFKICAKNKHVRATKHCIGNECEVLPAADCSQEENAVGWFHTHTVPGKERLSTSDIMYGIDKDFSCVGFRKDDENKILCFDYPYGIFPLQDLRESEDMFSIIESKLEKGIKPDCKVIV